MYECVFQSSLGIVCGIFIRFASRAFAGHALLLGQLMSLRLRSLVNLPLCLLGLALCRDRSHGLRLPVHETLWPTQRARWHLRIVVLNNILLRLDLTRLLLRSWLGRAAERSSLARRACAPPLLSQRRRRDMVPWPYGLNIALVLALVHATAMQRTCICCNGRLLGRRQIVMREFVLGCIVILLIFNDQGAI